MARSFRSSALVYVALLSAATAAVVVGCADSTDSAIDDTSLDGSVDSGKKDARADGSTSDDDSQDSGADAKKDSGTGTPDDDENGGDDAGDAGEDASDAADAGEDAASDAGGEDAASDAGGEDAASDAGADDAGDGTDADAGEPDAGAPDASDSDAGADAGDSGGAPVKPAQGEVVISEVMYNSSVSGDTDGEWIELYNTAAEARDLGGLVLRDGGNRKHTIRPGLVIAPATYVVLVSNLEAATAAKVPAGAIVYDYNTDQATSIQLANGPTGAIFLLDGDTEIARANYGPAVSNGGLSMSSATDQSIQLKTLTYDAAGLKENWCYSANAWAAGSDKGTPGAASDCN